VAETEIRPDRFRPGGAAWWWVLVPVGLAALAALAAKAGPFPALALILAATAGVATLMRPDAATLVTAFLLYTNVPAILTKEHGMPEALAGAFILLLAVPIGHALVVRRESLRFDTTLGLMFALLAVMLLSTLGAVSERIAIDRVRGFAIEGLLLYWLIVNAVRSVHALRKLFWALLVASSLLSVLSLYQDLTGSYQQEFGGLAHRRYDPQGAGPEEQEKLLRRSTRAQGPVDEPNRFAQILIVLVPIAAYMYRTAGSRLATVSAAGLGLLTLTGVLLTLSRGAFVTLALLAIMMARIKWVRTRSVVLGAVAVLAVLPVVSPFFLDRLVSIVDARHLVGDPSGYQQADGAMRGRTTEMLAALHVFRDHPLVGVGPGQFAPFYFQKYAASADIKFRDINVPRRAHNLYLELAAEWGALGLGVFVAIGGLLARSLWRARSRLLGRDGHGADLAAALCLSLLAYASSAMFLHLSYQRYYWLLLGVAGAALYALREVSGPAASRFPRGTRH